MALDQALLDFVAAGAASAFLRTYGWTNPTLSLGYFQPVADAELDPRWRGVPMVRRPSGGGAIWHHHELTYAVVVPASHRLARPSARLYRAVHTAIADALLDSGVQAARPGAAAFSRSFERRRPFLCFTDVSAEDIVACGVKIVGSAQRRRDGAVLQHGSVLLAHSSRTPELLGVDDVAKVPLKPLDWSAKLHERISSCVGLEAISVCLPDEVAARALELEQTVYRRLSWTRNR
jgi:lipoate-protein ligase A